MDVRFAEGATETSQLRASNDKEEKTVAQAKREKEIGGCALGRYQRCALVALRRGNRPTVEHSYHLGESYPINLRVAAACG